MLQAVKEAAGSWGRDVWKGQPSKPPEWDLPGEEEVSRGQWEFPERSSAKGRVQGSGGSDVPVGRAAHGVPMERRGSPPRAPASLG